MVETKTHRKWYVFYTYIRSELDAGAAIQDLGFQTFIPLEKRIRRAPNRKTQIVNSALFPRYGFVNFDIEREQWGQIRDVNEVIDVLRVNQVPVSVKSEIIEGFKLADSAGIFDRTKPPKVGMPIEVTSGPFMGWLGKIVRARSAERMEVALKLFGSEIAATIPLGSLKEIAA